MMREVVVMVVSRRFVALGIAWLEWQEGTDWCLAFIGHNGFDGGGDMHTWQIAIAPTLNIAPDSNPVRFIYLIC